MPSVSQQEIALALTRSACLIVVGLYAWWLTSSADSSLRATNTREPDALWDELGAPASMKEAALATADTCLTRERARQSRP
jgi:hypothetical protein